MKQQLTESSEGVQNTTPEIMLLWHIDYFELTSLENNQYKKSILTSPLPSENRKCNSHLKGQKKDNLLITSDEELR